MKASEFKPGVVFSYQRDRGNPYAYNKVVFKVISCRPSENRPGIIYATLMQFNFAFDQYFIGDTKNHSIEARKNGIVFTAIPCDGVFLESDVIRFSELHTDHEPEKLTLSEALAKHEAQSGTKKNVSA